MSIKNNTTDLQTLLDKVNALPEETAPEIIVNSSGLVTATAGSKSATHQLSSTDDSNFVPKNIAKGVTIFGVTGTMSGEKTYAVSINYNESSGNNLYIYYLRNPKDEYLSTKELWAYDGTSITTYSPILILKKHNSASCSSIYGAEIVRPLESTSAWETWYVYLKPDESLYSLTFD